MMAVVMAVMALWATVAIAAINEVQDGSALQAQEKNGKDQEQGHGDDQGGCGQRLRKRTCRLNSSSLP